MSREAIEEAIEVLEDASAEMLIETGDKNYYVEAIAVLRQALETEKQWRGLTKEEIAQGPQEVLPALYGRWGWAEKEAFEAVVAWAESKLKEKNNG